MIETILLARGNLKENTWKSHYIPTFNTFFFLGIICPANCHNILIEGNKVYNNGHGDNMRGIAISQNVADSIIKNNIVYNED
jgi:hypothetical protein